jgi:hypothetical protein
MRRGGGAGMAVHQLRVAHGGMRCGDVVAQHLGQRAELPRMHVRRPLGHAAQPRRLERAFERRVVADHEAQFLALAGQGVAERPQAVEFVAAHRCRRRGAAAVGPGGITRRHAGVVELLVAEQRPAVAADALRLADEQAQPAQFVGLQLAATAAVAALQRVDVAVQPRRHHGQ